MVKKGDVIGTIGSTGMTDKSKLSFGAMQNGVLFNPMDFYIAYDGVMMQ